MNQMMYYLIGHIGIAGEIPVNTIRQIPGGYEYKREQLREARNKKLVKVYNRDGVKAYRLTKQGKQFLMDSNPERFSFLLDGSSDCNIIPSALRRRLRLHRTAEAYLTMQNAGVEIYRDRKPAYFSGAPQEPVLCPAYYGSREIKEAGEMCVKVKNSRSVGMLVTPHKLFLVYNCCHSQMKWFERAEERFAFIAQELLRNAGAFSGSSVETRAILLADSMSRFHQFLDEPDRPAALPVTGGCFWNMHWVPCSREGEAVIRLLSDEAKAAQLRYSVLEQFSPLTEAERGLEVDALGSQGELVLLAYDLDVPRILRFFFTVQSRWTIGTVVCFDFQEEIVDRLCQGKARILTMSLDAIRQDFDL